MPGQFAESKEFPYDKEIPYHPGPGIVITSKLTSKSQTTVPQPVRRALGLAPGDLIHYEIENGRVILSRVKSKTAAADPFESFDEWRGQEDEDAYADL